MSVPLGGAAAVLHLDATVGRLNVQVVAVFGGDGHLAGAAEEAQGDAALDRVLDSHRDHSLAQARRLRV